MPQFRKLTDPSLAVIFATSPTGLGHLRVTEALYKGLPPTVAPVLLGAQDPSVSAIYRFVSLNPLTRSMMEFLYASPLDKPLVYFGRRFLRLHPTLLYQQLKTILSERLVVPETVLLVAPHAILGHQLAAIKEKVAEEMGVKIILVVQVTDDSSQPFWYVDEADLLVVPSEYTKEKLALYGQKAGLPKIPIAVTAYPISPLFAEEISYSAYHSRFSQLDPEAKSTLHMSVPVSGAAVGTKQIHDYVVSLYCLMPRVLFHMVSREAPYTKRFIEKVAELPFVHLHTSDHDRTTVLNYEHVFQEHPVSLEITKPSEQSFKVLATPKERGGAILLFSTPVGGQEYDNLRFMRAHGFIPNKADTTALWKLARKGAKINGTGFLDKARGWRGIRLPASPREAAAFTYWCHQQKLFLAMMRYTRKDTDKENLPNGVEQFWQTVEELLNNKNTL